MLDDVTVRDLQRQQNLMANKNRDSADVALDRRMMRFCRGC